MFLVFVASRADVSGLADFTVVASLVFLAVFRFPWFGAFRLAGLRPLGFP